MSNPSRIFDRALLARRRDRAAEGAPAVDFLLRRVADDFMDRLAAVNRQFVRILDLGAHHGLLARRLRELPGARTVVSADHSWRLLAQCPPPRVLADEELLPFRDGAFDLVASALALHLVNDLPGSLVQIRRVLKPDGLFLGAVLGGQTLQELRGAFLEAEEELEGGASPRVAPFADTRDYGGLLQRAGFALPVTDSDVVTVTYASPLALMRELKAMGASNMLHERRRKPLRRETLARASAIYEARFARPDGRITATFEIVTMTGWVPHESQQKPLPPGSAKMRLAEALGSREQPAGEKASPNRRP
jgi:NADH dehydrogenase [ubiquinone] 1 alpha subcomplex assembly factor 5